MVAGRESEPTGKRNRTTLERTSEREMVITRTFDAPARLVFEAWTTPELFKQWWVPKLEPRHAAVVRTGTCASAAATAWSSRTC